MVAVNFIQISILYKKINYRFAFEKYFLIIQQERLELIEQENSPIKFHSRMIENYGIDKVLGGVRIQFDNKTLYIHLYCNFLHVCFHF